MELHRTLVESSRAQASAEAGALVLERQLRERDAELATVKAQLEAALAWSNSSSSNSSSGRSGVDTMASTPEPAPFPAALQMLGVDAKTAALLATARLSSCDSPLRATSRAEAATGAALRASRAAEVQLALLLDRAVALGNGSGSDPPASAPSTLRGPEWSRLKRQRDRAKKQTLAFVRALITMRKRCERRIRRGALFARWRQRAQQRRWRGRAGGSSSFADLWDETVDPGAGADPRPFAAAARELHVRYEERLRDVRARAASVQSMHARFTEEKSNEVHALRAAVAVQQRRADESRNKCFELERAVNAAALERVVLLSTPSPTVTPDDDDSAPTTQRVLFVARRGITRCIRRSRSSTLRSAFLALQRHALKATHIAKLSVAATRLAVLKTSNVQLEGRLAALTAAAAASSIPEPHAAATAANTEASVSAVVVAFTASAAATKAAASALAAAGSPRGSPQRSLRQRVDAVRLDSAAPPLLSVTPPRSLAREKASSSPPPMSETAARATIAAAEAELAKHSAALDGLFRDHASTVADAKAVLLPHAPSAAAATVPVAANIAALGEKTTTLGAANASAVPLALSHTELQLREDGAAARGGRRKRSVAVSAVELQQLHTSIDALGLRILHYGVVWTRRVGNALSGQLHRHLAYVAERVSDAGSLAGIYVESAGARRQLSAGKAIMLVQQANTVVSALATHGDGSLFEQIYGDTPVIGTALRFKHVAGAGTSYEMQLQSQSDTHEWLRALRLAGWILDDVCALASSAFRGAEAAVPAAVRGVADSTEDIATSRSSTAVVVLSGTSAANGVAAVAAAAAGAAATMMRTSIARGIVTRATAAALSAVAIASLRREMEWHTRAKAADAAAMASSARSEMRWRLMHS